MRVAIYARVSSDDQHCEMQLTDLRGMAQRNGWIIVTEFIEKLSTRKRRPQLEQCLTDAKARRFDILLCWKLDRFGRTFRELVSNIDILDLAGVRFICGKIDTDKRDPVGRLTVNILASVAEFERDLIKERTTAGRKEYEKAYAEGKVGSGKDRESRSGKNLPVGRPRRVFHRDQAEKLRKLGHSWRSISKHLGVPVTTLRESLSC